MISDLLGICLMVIGVAMVIEGVIGLRRTPPESGISSAMFKAMCMPEYERRARTYCVINGMHPKEWERFASRAIGEIIMEAQARPLRMRG